uniref:KIB1-4 beta-propeller domain-containing protein n=1 Tax=Arundo donax TaxID=35708 RepID=A0A0A9CZ29_ARUDO
MMLDKALAGPRLLRFLNVSTGECIRMDLPELAEHTLLALTPEGLLLLLHEPSLVVRLLNPLTRQLTDLPPVTALLTPEQQRARRWGHKLGESIRVDGVGLVVDASTAAVRFHYPTVLAVAKPGDESWTVVDHGYINSVLPFGGRFYCATYNGVVVLNISSDQQMACLRMAVERSRSLINFSALKDSLHLVDNGRELMLVHRMLCPGNDAEDDVEDDAEDDVEDDAEDDGNYKMKYEVYRVDLNAGILIPVKSFNGQAVFMGRSRTISISAEAFPSVAADTLYMGFDCDEKRRMDGYNLADGSNEPCHYDPSVAGRVQPSTLIDCLSYCVRGIGKQLA